MSDRIAVMSKGQILQIDTAERLYEAPNCREVAGFIGSMNFLEGKLAGIAGDVAIVDAGPLGELRARLGGDGARLSDRVALAVRPEKLQMAEGPFDSDRFNSLRGRMVNRAYLGDRSRYFVEVDGLTHPLAVAAQNILRDSGGREMTSKQIWIGWPVDVGIVLVDRSGPQIGTPKSYHHENRSR